jgi:prolyl 4-hydroxylase
LICERDYETHIFIVRDILNPPQCSEFLETAKSMVWHDSASKADAAPTRNIARLTLKDGLLDKPFEKVFPQFAGKQRFLGLSYERVILAHYKQGDFFARHTDAVYVREPGARSMFSILVYLNDDFEGGETSFPNLRRIVKPEAGCALVFAHGHEHTGLPISRGEKYALHLFAMYHEIA